MLVTYQKDSIVISSFKSVAELLRVLTTVRKLSTNDIVKMSGLSFLTVQRILQGVQKVTKYTSEKLGKVFNFNSMYFYKKQLEDNIKALEKEIKQLSI